MFSYRFKVENPIYFPFRLKKDPSNMTYGNTDMALHKVNNQRTYKKIFIILHHGNLSIMHICLYISKTYLEHHIIKIGGLDGPIF